MGASDAGRRAPARHAIPAGAVLVAAAGLVCALSARPAAAQSAHERVLLLHSFGPKFAPFDEFSALFKRDLSRLSTTPVEFFEVSLETARFPETRAEGPLASYLSALFDESGIDLVVTVGGPAARFCLERREGLFAHTRLLNTGLETRVLGRARPPDDAASLTVSLDFPGAMDHILRVLPETTEIAVVLGGSALDRFWVDELQRELESFEDRVRFRFTHELSDPPEPPKRQRGLRGRVVAKKTGEMKEELEASAALVQSYIPPAAEKLQAAFAAGKATLTPGAATASVRFADYAKAGDALTLILDAQSKSIVRVEIDTWLDEPGKPVTLEVDFQSLPDGTHYPATTLLTIPDSHIEVRVEHSNYQKLAP